MNERQLKSLYNNLLVEVYAVLYGHEKSFSNDEFSKMLDEIGNVFQDGFDKGVQSEK